MTDKSTADSTALEMHENHDNTDVTEQQMNAQYLLNAPAYMSSAVRRQLLQEMVKGLPANVQKRINALRNIELERLQLEAKFYEEVKNQQTTNQTLTQIVFVSLKWTVRFYFNEIIYLSNFNRSSHCWILFSFSIIVGVHLLQKVYALERKYQDQYQPLHDKRRSIVTGDYEPSGKETEWNYEANDEDVTPEVQSITNELRKNLQLNYQDDVKGVPDFWLTIFRNTEMLSSMLQAPDEPALKKLIDIKIIYEQEPMSYTLEFHFEPNEYFTNTVLTKQYFLKSKVDSDYPFTFEGPEIFKCVGCNIDWHKGKNLTVKTIKRKQKHKARGAVRTVTKQVPADSFFNFFKPPQIQDESKIDLEDQAVRMNWKKKKNKKKKNPKFWFNSHHSMYSID